MSAQGVSADLLAACMASAAAKRSGSFVPLLCRTQQVTSVVGSVCTVLVATQLVPAMKMSAIAAPISSAPVNC